MGNAGAEFSANFFFLERSDLVARITGAAGGKIFCGSST